MTITRYGLGREYAGNTGSPAITEQADGAYVRYEDLQRIEAGHNAMHDLLVLRTRKAESAQPSVPAGWMLVPIEMTPLMLATAHETAYDTRALPWQEAEKARYKAMLEAAPPPHQQTAGAMGRARRHS